MVLGKIIIKSDYENKGDLVFRPLVRAFLQNGFVNFIQGDKVFLLGVIKNNTFYELFTRKVILTSDYEIISAYEFKDIIDSLSEDQIDALRDAINNSLSSKDYYSTMEDLADDRAVEFNAYNRNLSKINPYEEPLNGYSDFEYKCKKLEKKR